MESASGCDKRAFHGVELHVFLCNQRKVGRRLAFSIDNKSKLPRSHRSIFEEFSGDRESRSPSPASRGSYSGDQGSTRQKGRERGR